MGSCLSCLGGNDSDASVLDTSPRRVRRQECVVNSTNPIEAYNRAAKAAWLARRQQEEQIARNRLIANRAVPSGSNIQQHTSHTRLQAQAQVTAQVASRQTVEENLAGKYEIANRTVASRTNIRNEVVPQTKNLGNAQQAIRGTTTKSPVLNATNKLTERATTKYNTEHKQEPSIVKRFDIGKHETYVSPCKVSHKDDRQTITATSGPGNVESTSDDSDDEYDNRGWYGAENLEFISRDSDREYDNRLIWDGSKNVELRSDDSDDEYDNRGWYGAENVEFTSRDHEYNNRIISNGPEKVESSTDDSDDECDNTVIWDEVVVLSQIEQVPLYLAKSFVALLSEGCTLPFIARYRKTNVDYLMPDRLQDLHDSFQRIITLKKKTKTILTTLKKSKQLTPEIERSLLKARTLLELDLVYAPLKTHSVSLAEKARNLGLGPYAMKLLNGEIVHLRTLCRANDDELSSVEKVTTHITHIIADIIYKDTRVLERIRILKEETRFMIETTRTKSSTNPRETWNNKLDPKSDPDIYKVYFEWKCPVEYVKPHQTLAYDRGEDENVLKVKIIVPDWFHKNLERYCFSLWQSNYWVQKGLKDAYNRFIKPWLSRKVRTELTTTALNTAVKIFTTNLEKYLMTEPIKHRRIAGLDPGFTAGCKVGIIDTDGEKLEAFTIYPNFSQSSRLDPAAARLQNRLARHSVELIGLGNGTACRETESWLKGHGISDSIPVIIVPEQGASIYSISREAQKEHPNMDPNLISALSIARRVLDPLGELIKVDPKNLGVGLYQHNIPPNILDAALNCTVEKIVSLIGVDINTASLALLRRISGLNESLAENIIAYRQENGGFSTRAEILNVTGIQRITFQQCAGFLKVLGGSDPLDSTIIHPESYGVAKIFAQKISVDIKQIKQAHFPTIVEMKTSNIDLEHLSKELKTDVGTLELIISAFKQKSNEDNVLVFCKPVYSMAVQATDQLRKGVTITGVVRNVVPFGCFVDCGVGENGLIHSNQLKNKQIPQLGDRVLVTVLESPKPKRIPLKLEKILD